MALKKLGSTKLSDQVLQTSVNLAAEVSGTLGVANGGTGQSVFTDGQLLIGNTTGNTLTKATLTAGTNIAITNGAGSISVGFSGTLAVTSGGTGATTAANARTNLNVPARANSIGTGSLDSTLLADDQRTLTNPTTGIGYGKGMRLRFSSWNDDNSTPYADALDFSTWGDNTAGGFNALYLRKDGQEIRHKWAAAGGTSWTTKTLAYTDSSITGNAANVTGTVAVANGGTGQTTYTDGQLLIGNSTGNTLAKATLTAGTGISITNGAGSITIANTASGDPWTIRRLTTDFTTTASTNTLISDGTNLFRHRPAANTVTEYQALLMIQTSAATNNPRTAWEWATSLTDGTVQMYQTGAGSSTLVYESGNTLATVQIPAGGLPVNGATYPVRVWALTVAGGTAPGGFNQLMMAAETAGGTMTVRAGSFMKWRTL